jgi:hypothetical protein
VTKGATVFHTHRKALGTGLATALILAVTAAPAALAQPLDLRSPDARDAADGRQIVAIAPPTWPASPQPITTPRVVVSAPSSGLDWGSAGLGAAAVVGAVAIAAAGVVGLRRRRIARPAR